MDVEVLVLHLSNFGVRGYPLAISHVIDFDFILAGSFGDCINRVFLVDLWGKVNKYKKFSKNSAFRGYRVVL
jgi:hypothetical protein